MIDSLSSLVAKLPDPKILPSGEIHAPCPFCHEGVQRENSDGVIFYGEDRLIIFASGNGCFCRECARNSRGIKGNGFYPLASLAAKLNQELSPEFESDITNIQVNKPENPLRMLWTNAQVGLAHYGVDRDYWYRFGWTDHTINRFKLGRGTLYSRNPNMHLIPMKLTHTDGSVLQDWYMSSRGLNRATGEKVKERSPGEVKPYFWYIEDAPEDRSNLVLTEGEKDLITAWQLGYKNVVATFGTSHWSKNKCEYFFDLGYRHVTILNDGDEAGMTFVNHAADWFRDSGFMVDYLDWKRVVLFENPPPKDITEVLQISVQGYKEWTVQDWLQDSLVAYDSIPSLGGVNTGRYVAKLPDSFEVNLQDPDLTDLETLRSDSTVEGSITYEIADYFNKFRKPETLMLRVPPGGGKTHALISVAEQVAKDSMEFRLADLAKLQEALALAKEALKEAPPEELEELSRVVERLTKRIDEFSFNSVAFFGQFKEGYTDLIAAGADPSLWYDFAARNADNCKNLDMANTLGKNNHNIGTFCAVGCPFREECKVSGYLSQEQEKKSKPIVFYRHQHLFGSYPKEGRDLIIVDEYAGTVLENRPVTFTVKDVVPSRDSWDVDLEDRVAYTVLEELLAAIRDVMAVNAEEPPNTSDGKYNTKFTISGSKFLQLLDGRLDGRLIDVLESADLKEVAKNYQPTFIGGERSYIKLRCVPQLLEVVYREAVQYKLDNNNTLPSCLHLVGGKLELYAVEHLNNIPKHTPLIVADATGIPSIYEALFKRKVRTFAPRFRSPNAVTTVINGSDWTHGMLKKTLQKAEAAKNREMITELGLEKDIDTFIDDRVLQEAIEAIIYLFRKHESLLVVTHKSFRELLESTVLATETELLDSMPEKRLAWGHYGALRGTNLYKDFEAVVLIGAFRVPYDIVWRKIQMWAYLLGIKDEISPETTIKLGQYDLRKDGHGYRTFDHPFADEYVNMVEAGEMIQCAERIRPHASKGARYVYVFASRPALPFVDVVINKRSWYTTLTTRLSEVRDYILEYRRNCAIMSKKVRNPRYEDLAEKYGLSNTTIRKLLETMKAEKLI